MVNSTFPDLSPQFEDELQKTFKLLADQCRFRILLDLARNGEKNVSDLCALLDQSQPAVSHHLGLLRIGGLITMRRAGKNNFYAVDASQFSSLLGKILLAFSDGSGEFSLENLLIRYSFLPDAGSGNKLNEMSTAQRGSSASKDVFVTADKQTARDVAKGTATDVSEIVSAE